MIFSNPTLTMTTQNIRRWIVTTWKIWRQSWLFGILTATIQNKSNQIASQNEIVEGISKCLWFQRRQGIEVCQSINQFAYENMDELNWWKSYSISGWTSYPLWIMVLFMFALLKMHSAYTKNTTKTQQLQNHNSNTIRSRRHRSCQLH